MPLIPNNWLFEYYVLTLVVAVMLVAIVLVDRETERMSVPHAGFFYFMSMGLLIEGVFGLAGSHNADVFLLAFLLKAFAFFAFCVSLFCRVMSNRFRKPTYS